MSEPIPDTEYENIDNLRSGDRFKERLESYYTSRGLSELEFLEEVVGLVQSVTGVLDPWQQFYIVAAVSGRGVEWAQTRGRPHYHIMGLPCSICGRG